MRNFKIRKIHNFLSVCELDFVDSLGSWHTSRLNERLKKIIYQRGLCIGSGNWTYNLIGESTLYHVSQPLLTNIHTLYYELFW
jgi:hypothetical protein